ncbi:hypothetical protein [Paenibacillus ginsengarvi]|uniref:Uncharacterized protein n=1 Tax=Paenibacillus ginsengarvi TaxID=400777 RepID=A0A3B0CS97_9BACL|nr:hypothetical protein [Paenibacillus ginsengarvi]RKN86761.1 hypothetical protein D7M11_02040 [Paenibacillus ginsengarvi]
MKPNIAEIKKMLAAATPGPWEYSYEYDEIGPRHDTHGDFAICKNIQWYDNGILISRAPETIESLIGEVERQTEENENLGNENIRYTKALEFIIAAYEEEGTDIQVARKMVKLAREALRKGEQTNG